ncbi:hypothetical protein B4064_0890 [Caldibacillus thermoamylovorans]|uniref:Uncharacterized protein n=1 Tax=Caldibacillus thermoamylovorans TaxID=35841 RepID=A0A0D0FMR8_9BACI|nr:hypothetical protein B4065_1059 [Caldibacillus thermoamylovorans]KIO67269.1 hypothetical protein B4064_0890 [Caldibacillus thermoamylovorans]KIO68412.1 hypothetical protein B4166_2188 [Caldibacillus thermoamylovorans]KIO73298.1 hypothetical protein B4167_2271 [Caldibacillus thermoamylovorans]
MQREFYDLSKIAQGKLRITWTPFDNTSQAVEKNVFLTK